MTTKKKEEPPTSFAVVQPEPAEPLAQLYTALAKAILEAEPVTKASTNKHHGYKYASSDHVFATAREALAKHGLALVCVNLFVDQTAEKIVGTYDLVHSGGGVLGLGKHDLPYLIIKGRPIDKAVLGARTELLAYVARDTLQLPRLDANDDVSGRDDTDYVPSSPPKPTPGRPDDWQERVDAAKGKLIDLKTEIGPRFDMLMAGHPKETLEDLEAAVAKADAALGSNDSPAARFWDLADALGWTDQDASDDLRELYGVTDTSNLTVDQLDESIARLEANLKEQNRDG